MPLYIRIARGRLKRGLACSCSKVVIGREHNVEEEVELRSDLRNCRGNNGTIEYEQEVDDIS
jgi:hypothetical protein